MTSKIIIWIVVVGAVVYGIYTLATGKPQREEVREESTQVQQEETATQGKKMAFSEFIKRDTESYQCDVNQYLENMDSKGTVYISKGNVKGTFTTSVGGKTITTSLLVKDGYQYVWSSPLTNGVKIQIPRDGVVNEDIAPKGTFAWNAEQLGDYKRIAPEEWVRSGQQIQQPLHFLRESCLLM